jgi:tetratricopeptide (TPR) repeat protein
MRRAIYDGDHPETAYSLTHLAATKLRLGDKASAEALYDEALAMRRRLYGSEHPDIAASLNNVGNMRLASGDLAGAERSLRESLDMISRLKAEDSLEVSNASNNLARVLLRREKHAEATVLYRRALDIREKRLKAADGRVWASRLGLAASLLSEMGGEDAIQGLADLELAIEGTPARRAAALVELAARLKDAGQWRDAAAMLDGVLLIEETQPGSAPIVEAFVFRAECALRLGALEHAEELLARARPLKMADDVADRYRSVLAGLIAALESDGQTEQAQRCAGLALR